MGDPKFSRKKYDTPSHPWQATRIKEENEILKKYVDFNAHLRPPRTLVPDIPHAIERVILKCLEKEPGRRYPAMSLVVRDLQT